MTIKTKESGKLRVLLACARPLADRLVTVQVKVSEINDENTENLHKHFIDDLNLAFLAFHAQDNVIGYLFTYPVPDADFIISETKKLDFVNDVKVSQNDPQPNDVHGPGEDLGAILTGLEDIDKSVQVSLITRATPDDIYDHLENGPGYDVFHYVGHGSRFGTLLFDDSRGWTKHVNGYELAHMIGEKVSIFINCACHGEKSLAFLLDPNQDCRPKTMIFAQGEYPIQVRAMQLFAQGFYRSLVSGNDSAKAFKAGKDKVKRDDYVGERACPDGADDGGPSPYKRIKIDHAEPVEFSSILKGKLEIVNAGRKKPAHVMTRRFSDIVLGREVLAVSLIDKLLPPRKGRDEDKPRFVNLYGEGGIGKTTLAQLACDHLWDLGRFKGGIYEVDCEQIKEARQLAVGMLIAMGYEDAEKTPKPEQVLVKILKDISEFDDILFMLDNVDIVLSDNKQSKEIDPAQMLVDVLTQCPKMRIAATCRAKLNIAAHSINFDVKPLDIDSSLALFMALITDDLKSQILGLPEKSKDRLFRLICEFCGHALSIFLVAKRFSIGNAPLEQQIEQALENTLTMLKAPEVRGLSERQKSLKVCLDQSFNLLSKPAQKIFAKSSFFPGGIYRDVSTLDDVLGKDWRESMDEANSLGLCWFDKDTQLYWTLNPIREYAETKVQDKEVFYKVFADL